ncbi:t10 [Tupaiid betaherpesvirus 1]|uniref:T10 n=1 Tax=Tupaiid herpesvirus 1 (strain 1) TaxID=10397 RepID=Q91TJ3_TUHV1|nr:t10 [Tupaiid betaherpesvirus 1]AAK57154.1 t10 [Tupaiid betaherpesvirus 1]
MNQVSRYNISLFRLRMGVRIRSLFRSIFFEASRHAVSKALSIISERCVVLFHITMFLLVLVFLVLGLGFVLFLAFVFCVFIFHVFVFSSVLRNDCVSFSRLFEALA